MAQEENKLGENMKKIPDDEKKRLIERVERIYQETGTPYRQIAMALGIHPCTLRKFKKQMMEKK